ncbi:hypothetical protein L6164_015399 [Bauhinia variegata]|uniref:Uncharacterized protein n=1 Tax=Bauhinia variegata TaxID=167791 RepID=A0ACB9NKI5_BAUVA|nr:hypothetical protein L6164_015399 [Bauhinia variegata]
MLSVLQDSADLAGYDVDTVIKATCSTIIAGATDTTTGQHFELLPFGGGRRSCPGISFGLQMTHLALAALLQAFEITTPSNAPVDMTATFGLTNIKTTPLEVFVKPRLSPLVYHTNSL